MPQKMQANAENKCMLLAFIKLYHNHNSKIIILAEPHYLPTKVMMLKTYSLAYITSSEAYHG